MGYQTVFLNTNGTLLSKDLSNRLATYEGLLLSISLEGSKSLHDRFRGNGSYMPTIQGISHALDKGIDLYIFTTACKSLLRVLSQFAYDLFNKFPDISNLMLIQLISPTNGDFAFSNELLDTKNLLQLIDKVSLLNLLGQRTCFLNNPLAYVASKLLKILWVPRSNPLYSEGSLMIMANKDICLSHSTNDGFGKYKIGMIEKVLTSNSYRKAVHPDETTCPACRFLSLCRENGMTHPIGGYRGIQSDDLYCQEVLSGAVR
jgi:sulfatase maturation enzyme AslB (radical SAM superfamily)